MTQGISHLRLCTHAYPWVVTRPVGHPGILSAFFILTDVLAVVASTIGEDAELSLSQHPAALQGTVVDARLGVVGGQKSGGDIGSWVPRGVDQTGNLLQVDGLAFFVSYGSRGPRGGSWRWGLTQDGT